MKWTSSLCHASAVTVLQSSKAVRRLQLLFRPSSRTTSEFQVPRRVARKKETICHAVLVKRRLKTAKVSGVELKDSKNQTGKRAEKTAKMAKHLSGPCKLVSRAKDKAGYILDKEKIYVCSASERRHGHSI